MMAVPVHFASVDLEDWYTDVEAAVPVDAARFAAAFHRQVDVLLDVLARTATSATFFVLGRTAERFPDVVRRIAAAGHEIASHGYGHARVSSLAPATLAADIGRSVDVLAAITGARPVGYRAPYFSAAGTEAWFYPTLASLGFRYSSSVRPGGLAGGGAPAAPTPIPCPGGAVVHELPVAALRFAGALLPVAGGGFWRALPAWAIERAVHRFENEGRSFSMYLHPHELDPAPLRSGHGLGRDVYVNLGRASVPGKLERVLRQFSFRRFGDAPALLEGAGGTA